ncbi:lipase [Corynebacterium yudongzhengii]|uniref:Lipase n=1 Tax=Corynebacterium yudongzhengii TaxID=2080740 RepID=A0A2U1T5Y4_9CORY|nr:lipase family protein [Corynebacterium yudongzhengii]AWB82634.1 lipase [Corynebacterium yudongzhengii]PWC01402.1 lipase [Corynebacterium yudongzhengii]
MLRILLPILLGLALLVPAEAHADTTPGQLINRSPAAHPLEAYRILYTSTTADGRPVEVSGFVIEPVRPWPGEGPTPTIVFAPGTRGAGDQCAPSRADNLYASLTPRNINVNYEVPLPQMAALGGVRAVVTDYVGLGTDGPHTYVHHTEEAHAVLDAARAIAGDGPVGFYGYSQGGGATAAAAEHAASYAPELDIRGTYAGAPPADLASVLGAVDGSSIVGVLGYAMAGFADRDPEFAAALDEILNDKGRHFLADNANNCIVDSTLKWAMTDTRQLTVSGETLTSAALNDPVIAETFAREKLGQAATTGPIMISSSTADDIIPNGQVRQLAADYCAAGSTVEYRGHEVISTTSSLPYAIDHALGMALDVPDSLVYLFDRFHGTPAPTNC